MKHLTAPTKTPVDPWMIPVEIRVGRLVRARQDGFRVVVFLHEAASPATFRYRAYNPCQYLEESDTWRGFYFFEVELDRLIQYLDGIDVLILVRYPWTANLAEVLRAARRRGIPILFDIDDMVFQPAKVEQMANSTGKDLADVENREVIFAESARLDAVGRFASGGIATTPELASIVEDHFQYPCAVLKNGVNREQIEVSREVCASKEGGVRKPGPPFRLGFFSGTQTHSRDLGVMVADLLAFLEANPGVVVSVVGLCELGKPFERMIAEGRIEPLPLQNFLRLQWVLGSVDLVLVPLAEGVFTRCKSELKFFEAALVRTPVLVSANPLYRSILSDGENGFLCESGRWRENLERVFVHRGRLDQVGRNAEKDALNGYASGVLRPRLEGILEHCLERGDRVCGKESRPRRCLSL